MLLASMISPETSAQMIPLQLELVPTGFVDKSFTALVQLSVSGSSGNGGTWDLAASAVSGGRVTEDGSGRIVTSHAGALVVLEREMRFAPGPYEIVGVAQNELTGALGSRREEGRWPDPDAQDAVVGPIAVLQPVRGAFLREGRASSTGALARSADETAKTDRPTALVGLICRRRGLDGPLHVERVLVGETEAPFVPMDFLPEDGRCVQVRDLVPAGTLLEGAFRYQVRVVRNGAEIARGERRFVAVAPDAVPPAAPGKPS
jgi:hypothetical protein